MATRKVYEFGEFQLDPAQRRLEKKGDVVALHAKAFDALVYLVEHAGEPVSRRALTEALWPKRVVEENNLTQAISALRRALGDECIVTLAGRGYQFVAEVRAVDVNSSGEAAPESSSDSRSNGDARLALKDELVHASASRPLWRRAFATAAAIAVGAVLTGALVAMLVGTPERTLPVTRFVITTEPGAPLANLGGYDVIISPDGRRIAYVGRNVENDSVALYVREMDRLEARLVTGTGLANVVYGRRGGINPFFSPDSRSIGFMSPDRGVMRGSIDGGPAIKMVDAPATEFFGAVWDADDTIIYSAGGSLRRASVGGGASESLTEEMPNAFITGPVMLPGGRAVMYALIEGAVQRVAVFDLDTREQKIIIANGQSAFYSDTGHVVFARGTTIMAAPFDASALEVTGEPVVMIENVRHTTGPIAATDFGLSASGTLVYVPTSGVPTTFPTAVVWVDRTGKVMGPVIDKPVEFPEDPALSPDGTRLALTSGPELKRGDLWSYDLQHGGLPIRLAVDGHNAVWSPDSKQLAFRVSSAPNIHTVLADGSMQKPRPLREPPVLAMPRAWSAAGELFVVVPPPLKEDIAAITVEGNDLPRKVDATQYQEIDPALSPDGRWLAYASDRIDRLEVWVKRYPDGAPVQVSTGGGFEPRWSADGHELFYLQPDSVMFVKVQAGAELSFSAPEPLFSGRYVMLQEGETQSYDVSRDGRFVMIERPAALAPNAAAQSIVVVQNWTRELEQRVPGRRRTVP